MMKNNARLYNGETMETNQPGIFLAGVVCGGFDTHIQILIRFAIFIKETFPGA